MDSALPTMSGRLFQAVGPANAKARLPNSSRVRGTMRWPLTLSAAMMLPWTTRLVRYTHRLDVDRSQAVQCLVDEQTEFERDALRNAQPMQVVANQWRHVVILAATKERHISRRAALCLSAVECRWRVVMPHRMQTVHRRGVKLCTNDFYCK